MPSWASHSPMSKARALARLLWKSGMSAIKSQPEIYRSVRCVSLGDSFCASETKGVKVKAPGRTGICLWVQPTTQ
jgi:hypothetical protein